VTTLNDNDLILINAYLDDELSAGERAAFEQRLAHEPALQEELDGLRITVALMHMAEPVRVPRNFTLDPAVYGKPVRPSFWEQIGLGRVPRMAMVGATVVVTVICAGAIVVGLAGRGLTGPGVAGVAQPEVSMMDAAEEDSAAAQEAPATSEMFYAEEAEATGEPFIEMMPPSELTREYEDQSGFDTGGPSDTGGTGAGGGNGGAGGAGATGPADSGAEESTGGDETGDRRIEPTPAQGGITAFATEEPTAVANAGGEPLDNGTANDTDSGALTTKESESASFPVIPLAVGALVVALGIGLLLARRMRRRAP
jgi:hypothetical protein